VSRANPQLIARVRELMRLKMNVSIADALKSAPADLQALGAGALSQEENQLLLRAMEAVSGLKRAGLLPRFEESLQRTFDEKIGWLSEMKLANTSHGFAEFDLLDDSALAQQMALRKLVQKTLEELDRGALVAVEVRMSDVLGVPKVEGVRNPIGPGTILKAARSTLEDLVADEMVRDAVTNVFQPHLCAGLNDLYDDLNVMLIEAGIQPSYRPQIERDTSNRQGVRRSAEGVSISQAMSLRDLLPGSTSSPIDLGAIFAALLQGATTNRKYGARMLADEAGALYAQAANTPVNAELLKVLTQMQGAAMLPGHGEAVAQDLRSVVQHMQTVEEHPLDQLTGELVASVFDLLLLDEALPDTVKKEIGRMQIVALKAALLDRSFFARREHPLRLLLDDITAAGSDPLVDVREEGQFIQGLRVMVDHLVTDFENDLVVFEEARVRLRGLSADPDPAIDTALMIVTEQLLAEEREAQAESQAEEAVHGIVTSDTPTFIRDFCQTHWRRVLTKARADADETGWIPHLQTMEALLFSVRPKERQDVAAFTASLPALVKNLQRGFSLIDIADEDKRAFMDALMQAHTAVLQQARTTEFAFNSKKAAEAVAYRPPEQKSARRPLLPLRALIAFTDVTPVQRARLGWVSPAHTRYAFIAAAAKPRGMSADELSMGLAQGWVHVLGEEESVMRRALAAVMGEKDAQP
jgi:hypothetical protein